MKQKAKFTVPELTEYGALTYIVRMPHEGTDHGVTPPGWDGRTPECQGGEGPGKAAPKADAIFDCGSS